MSDDAIWNAAIDAALVECQNALIHSSTGLPCELTAGMIGEDIWLSDQISKLKR